jgi:hypothetical protein
MAIRKIRPDSSSTIDTQLSDALDSLDSQATINGWQLIRPPASVDDVRRDSFAPGNLDHRFLILPRAWKDDRRIGIVSSRVSRSFDEWSDWFRALRCAVAASNPRDVLAIAPGTTTAPFVQRAAELFGQRVLSLDIAEPNEALADWSKRVSIHTAVPPKARTSKILISPLVSPVGKHKKEIRTLEKTIPFRDQALFAVSQQVIALHVRSNSNTLELLQHRLQRKPRSQDQTQIALGRRLISAKLRDRLLDSGAVGRAILTGSSREQRAMGLERDGEITIESFRDHKGEWPFLTHCTRRRRGPWPGQSDRGFIDDLILQRTTAHHSALDSLHHILRTDRLVASSESIRGTGEVVCFTAVPLGELRQLRVFRPHRGRWDFEPYGICLRRDYLGQIGVFPVKYVNQTTVDSGMAAHTNLQRSASRTRTGRTLDWTVEQEWRHIGDLNLGEIPEDAAFVFVPTATEALAIQSVSRWPVVVVPPIGG